MRSVAAMVPAVRMCAGVACRGWFGPLGAATIGVLAAVAGCHSEQRLDGNWANPNYVQVQFYAPPNVDVTITGEEDWERLGSKDVPGANPRVKYTDTRNTGNFQSSDRLEHAGSTVSVFNLSPGKGSRIYWFKYTGAAGFTGADLYGQIEVFQPRTRAARTFVEHAFVPVVLPSEFQDSSGENFYPARGPSGAGLSTLELSHLRQGDLVQKVYFVADLENAWEGIRMIDYQLQRLRSAEVVLNSELELVDRRHLDYRRESLYSDPTNDAAAAWRDRDGRSAKYIELEADRQELQNKRYLIRNQIDDLEQERRIRVRLLDSMRIVHREGSLVLATPENQWPYHDTRDQVSFARGYKGFKTGPDEDYRTGDIVIPPLGEVVVELRVGGRHMNWAAETPEVASSPTMTPVHQ